MTATHPTLELRCNKDGAWRVVDSEGHQIGESGALEFAAMSAANLLHQELLAHTRRLDEMIEFEAEQLKKLGHT